MKAIQILTIHHLLLQEKIFDITNIILKDHQNKIILNLVLHNLEITDHRERLSIHLNIIKINLNKFTYTSFEEKIFLVSITSTLFFFSYHKILANKIRSENRIPPVEHILVIIEDRIKRVHLLLQAIYHETTTNKYTILTVGVKIKKERRVLSTLHSTLQSLLQIREIFFNRLKINNNTPKIIIVWLI